MPADTYTLLIDDETQDLTFDEFGNFELVQGNDTLAQCVRLTLQAYLKQFPLDTSHGTQWTRVLGKKMNELSDTEIDSVLRAAILQETEILFIESISFVRDYRGIDVTFTAKLRDGGEITLEVNTRGG
ncbi:hypothetical protein FACS1894184_19620 [Clostridia bacterium]|nr:hypothetical protein FACS1894184_19620 [Clostridia bacterium]